MTLSPDDPVTALDGVGPATAGRLADVFGITTVSQLVEHWPRRYHDAGEVRDLREVAEGEPATLLGEVVSWSTRRTNRRGGKGSLDIAEAQVRQASGTEFAVTFFNQRWRPRQLPAGTVAGFSGKVGRFRGSLRLSAPDVQVLGRVDDAIDAADAAQRLRHQRLLAVYPATDGLASFRIAELIADALDGLPGFDDWLDPSIRDEFGFVDRDTAVRWMHRPEDRAAARAARDRLVFDELFLLQLGTQSRRARFEVAAAGLDNAPRDDGHAAALIDALPFEPTGAQRRAFDALAADLAAARPMHRLLQGDVGAGKTLVALWAMLAAVDNGRQAALMAPTEVLADQHLRSLQHLLAPLGVNVLDGLRIDALTASAPVARRRRILAELLSGQLDIVVGTHALLEEGVRFADLGVVVVDEQHRFGVAQRIGLKEKAAAGPHGPRQPDVLVMTATPIPRSLAMTVYGDLDVTELDELPAGRQPVSTQLITPARPDRREALYAFIREEVRAGRRAYVVCPFVEPSESVDGVAAVAEHQRLAEQVFDDIEVGLVHGRMRADDKDAAMAAFRDGRAPVLVSTTVIEVGVDVAEATVMVVEDAERFGISQLHQLRGRVGRGPHRSYCALMAGWNGVLGDDARDRLDAVCSTTDGFRLAEADLALRGAGELLGRRQSGAQDLRLTDLRRDTEAIRRSRSLARAIVTDDPTLSDPSNSSLRTALERRFPGGVEAFAALDAG